MGCVDAPPLRTLLAERAEATSRNDLAARLGVSVAALSHWINAVRTPSMAYVGRIAQVLDLDERQVKDAIADLQTDTQRPGPPPRPVPATSDLAERVARLEAEQAAERAQREADRAELAQVHERLELIATLLERSAAIGRPGRARR